MMMQGGHSCPPFGATYQSLVQDEHGVGKSAQQLFAMFYPFRRGFRVEFTPLAAIVAFMRLLLILLFTLGLFAPVHAGDEVSGRVLKVLPLLLDREGQVAQSPSLFDRDAYQAELRAKTNLVSGIRYDVLWSAKNAAGVTNLNLRVELRGVDAASQPKFKTLQTPVMPGKFRKWTSLPLTSEEYHSFVSITAWRATLWEGDRLLGEQKSFLW